MRLLTNHLPILDKPPRGGGGFVNNRARTTRYAGADVLATSLSTAGVARVETHRSLSTEQLFEVYSRVPDVRAAIDSVVRRVATTDFYVQPIEGAIEDSMKEEAMKVAQEATRWFRAPMMGRPWQTWATMVVNDLLVYDATAWEKVMEAGALEELFPSRGDDWWPVVDNTGRATAMEQRVNGNAKSYEPERIVYLNLFPNTSHPRGMPLIETLLTEVISIVRGAERAMMTLDASEIPPGILYLTGVAGKAAEDTVNSFTKDKGRDHKMRVLHFPAKGVGDIQWIRLDSTPRELEMREVIDQIRRTIWRVFGVFPVEMGATDGMPRATAEVQMDASASHLIIPILELLQETISTQVLPLLLDPKWHGLLEFSFDFTRDLSPAEAKAAAETDKVLIEQGVLSRNEVRAIRGFKPIDGGDVITVAGTVQALEHALEKKAPNPAPGQPPTDPTDPAEDPEGDPEPTDDNEGGDAAPGEVEQGRPVPHRHGEACDHRAPPAPEGLPSDWQPAGRFKGHRTIDLLALGGVVSRYDQTIGPIFDQTQREIASLVQAAYSDGQITTSEAAKLSGDLARSLSSLVFAWESETAEMYDEAAKIGERAAVEFAGAGSSIDAKQRASLYATRAIGYLTANDGPIEDIRQRVLAILGEVARSKFARTQVATIPEGVEPGCSTEVLLSAVNHAFERNKHRIANYGGKLIELAGEAAKDGLVESGNEKSQGPTEWMIEWVNVGDSEMCKTCTSMGRQGFIPLRTLATVPGGSTECRARDRCVLVYWTEEEVRGGKAVMLGGGNTGEVL